MDLYNSLESLGLSQNEIDQMDIVYFIKKLARKLESKQPKRVTIADQAPAWL